MFKTKACELFGIEHPIVLAGMGGVSTAGLVAAVSNAGGLGVVGGAMMSPDRLRSEIQRTKALTDKPFAVDLLAPDPDLIREQIKVIYDEGVKIFVAGLAVPEAFVDEMHERDITVVVMVGKVRHAEKSAEAGADAVVAQGTEAGGHTGLVGGMALIPQVVDAVDIPVLAAGGITDGRGMVAALALGAQGVVIGTRFIATHEASAADCYRQELVEKGSADTVRTRCYTGKPARAIRNRYTDNWEGRADEIEPFPVQAMRSQQAGLMSYAGESGDGDPEQLFMPAGQGIGMIDSVKSADEVFHDILSQARQICGASPFQP